MGTGSFASHKVSSSDITLTSSVCPIALTDSLLVNTGDFILYFIVEGSEKENYAVGRQHVNKNNVLVHIQIKHFAHQIGIHAKVHYFGDQFRI